MAKRYSGSRGKSGSQKPEQHNVPSWLRYKGKEIELLVVKLAKEGQKPSEIGMHLRDTYGIPDIKLITKKSISQILKEKNHLPELPEDLRAVIEKSVQLSKHLEENHKDFTAKRGLQLTDSRIKRLVDYYKKSGRIPADFKYDRESIKLYAQ
ncbi:MAG: 30S ribosomal protein S15 [Nanoarchaeota archaeon]